MDCVIEHVVNPRFEAMDKQFKILQKQLTEIMTVLNEVKEQQRSLTMQFTQVFEDMSITPTEKTNINHPVRLFQRR